MDKRSDSFFLSNKKNSNVENKKSNINQDGGNRKKQKEKEFDKNRPGLSETTENGKKPFDKKLYRMKKYSKKYKLEQWEEQRKKRLLHDYQKSIKNDPLVGTYKPRSFDEDSPDSAEAGRFVKHPDLLEKEQNEKAKKAPFAKAKEQFQRVKQEKQRQQEEKEKANKERMQKLQEYKKKKQETFKKLSKKNKKGQPVMSGRMELLLDKIKGSK